MTLESIREEIKNTHKSFACGFKPFTPYIGMKYVIELKFKNYHVFISDLSGSGVCEMNIKDNELSMIGHTFIDEIRYVPYFGKNRFVCSLRDTEVFTIDF